MASSRPGTWSQKSRRDGRESQFVDGQSEAFVRCPTLISFRASIFKVLNISSCFACDEANVLRFVVVSVCLLVYDTFLRLPE